MGGAPYTRSGGAGAWGGRITDWIFETTHGLELADAIGDDRRSAPDIRLPHSPHPAPPLPPPMTDDSSVFEGPADEPPAPARDDNPPQTVSELSFALKRTLENDSPTTPRATSI